MAAGSVSTAIGGRSRPILKEPDDMKTLFVTIALAIASPALAWDDNDAIREQGFEAQQRLQDMANANAAAMQQRQQAQSAWAWRCAAQNYQHCY
jgi:hypothetical protein